MKSVAKLAANRLVRTLLASSMALSCGAQAVVTSGQITDVPDSQMFSFGDGTNMVTGFWSIFTNHEGYFYGQPNQVAFAAGVSDISQLTDASAFAFTSSYVGPLCDAACAPNGVGDFVLWRNAGGYYGALRIDQIHYDGGDPYTATLSGTWWFQSDGSPALAVPEPGQYALWLSGLGMLGCLALRSRRPVKASVSA